MSSKRPFLQLPWRSRSTIARDVDAELSFHLDMRVKDHLATGLSPDEAQRRAREEFGDIEFTRAYCRGLDERAERETRLADRIAEWRQDAVYAVRTLRRSPGFAAVSLLTLALAIGANTAIFTVVRAVLLKPLPYGAPESLYRLFESWPGVPGNQTPMSPADFADYNAQQRGFTDIAALGNNGPVTWQPEHADPEALTAVQVGARLFNILQVRAVYGRTFAPGEDTPGKDDKVVLSYHLWQRELGGDPAVVGRRMSIGGHPYEILGVMPRDFTLGDNEDLWMPLDIGESLADVVRSRKQHWVQAIGRVKPGVSIDGALADLQVVAHRLAVQYPEADSGRAAVALPMRDVMVGNLRPALLLLQGAAAMVLLIACANLANLTLSRTMGRRRELAVRAALGAGRGRLVRQLITESIILALAGGVAGVVLAVAATRMLLALNPNTLPSMFATGVDGHVLLFSLGLSVATGVLCGLVPALDAARADLHESLKEGGRGSSGGRGGERVRRALVVAQVAMALMLLVGAGLLIRSFSELTRVRFGFDPDHVLTAQLRAAGVRYDSSTQVNRFYDGVLRDIASAPGVVAVGGVDYLPTRGRVNTTLRIEGEPVDEKNLPDLGYESVIGDYFKAMHIPLVQGRLYDATDTPDGLKTVIINETAARRFFPKGDAIGRRIRIGPDPKSPWITIVGIVGDVHDEALDIATKPTMFANHRQEAWESAMIVVVRTAGDPRLAEPAIRSAVRTEDPQLAVRDVNTLNDIVGSSLASRRFALGLASSFAAVALALAAIGIYGVLAYMVTIRTREFGVRLALGATARSVLLLVIRQGLAWSLVGLAIGVGGAVGTARLLDRMLYGVTPFDVSTYAAVVGALLGVALTACLVPAIRATRVDPLTSMRAE